MSLEIAEFIDDKKISIEESADEKKGKKPLIVDIEGLHAYPYATRNSTRYMPEALMSSVNTLVSPYRRPLIEHHNTKDGKVIGRVMTARYIEKSPRSNTPALGLTVAVIDEDAKEAVQDGRLSTVSMGILAHDVRCSICGQQLSNGDMCEHERGKVYETEDGTMETCYWDVYSMEAKEVSYVVVPADIYASNVSVSPSNKSQFPELNESFDDGELPKGEEVMQSSEKELKDAKAKIAELESKNKELEESAGKAEELEKANTELQNKVTALEEEKKSLEEAAKENEQLREGLETELSDVKANLKESLIETMQIMRKVLGKSALDAEKVKDRSEDSIKDSIVDMKEEFDESMSKAAAPEPAPAKNLDEGAGMPEPDSVKDPSLHKDSSGKDMDESVDEGQNVDLRAGLESLFMGMMSMRR